MSRVQPLHCVLLLAAAVSFGGSVFAGDAPDAPSSHQLMKDCMAKQKASESGKTRAEHICEGDHPADIDAERLYQDRIFSSRPQIGTKARALDHVPDR